MTTITLPKNEYEELRKKASLCERIFRFIPEGILKTEDYSKERISEFLKEDKIDKKAESRLKNLLKSL
ncbi:hypothetical protein KKA24_02820 [Patescibacteria group bacterium]|nr:hypothetical protein [Patescibacteria group bacterium]